MALANHLSDEVVLNHPVVVGELACGNLKRRAAILSDLNALSAAKVATNTEVLRLVEDSRLWGRGLGWIGVHLLASALLSNCPLWTPDVRLGQAARELGLC